MPDIICAVHIPPVYTPTDACLKNTTWSASARLFTAIPVSQRRLGFVSPGPSEVQPARARHSVVVVVVDVGLNFPCPKTSSLITRPNKQTTRVPSPHPIWHQKPVFRFAQKRLDFATRPNSWARISHENPGGEEMEIVCLFSNSRRLLFGFIFFFQLMIQRIPFKQHNTKNYLSRYRGQMPDIICAVHIPPVYLPTYACLKNTTWSASARLFPATL